MVWYVVVVPTTTCWQLGNDTTYDTEKRTRHHMMSPTHRPCRAVVSGRHEDMFQNQLRTTSETATFPAKLVIGYAFRRILAGF